MPDASVRETPADRRARQREEIATISGMLQERVHSLAPILLPDGTRVGMDWRDGAHGVRSIRLTGALAGVYRDFREAKGTDMLGAVQALLCDGNFVAALGWSRSWLGLSSGDERAMELARRRAADRRARAEARAARDAEERGRRAGGLWHSAVPIPGTPADRYLAGRGIHLDRLARPPGALRYSAEVWCKARRGEHPAMVSGLWRIGTPKLRAAHRTFLDERPDGGVGKADVDPVRSILGSWPGAVVPIQRGETDARWTAIGEGELVAFGEGIEEGLSIALVKPAWRVGAVGFVGGFGQVELPVWCHVLLCINNDAEGSPAWRAIHGDDRQPGAVRELEARGHVVRVMRPPEDFADWNDLLRGVRRGR